ncbi:hypothetical protein V5O48_011144 [Marasmius crinis-equi]|uniref:MFS general substrate transporter n=1 Tax=Marasmius crinis-equi TaxID=585013 RepID=A0ABR3F6E0_9AGAR
MSRPRGPNFSRSNSTRAHTPTVPTGEDVVMGDGAFSADDVEYLHEFVHHHHETEETLVDEQELVDEEEERRKTLPWWRRPSPWWLMGMMPFSAMAMAATIAPKVEIYTMLACRVHKPDIYYESGLSTLTGSNLHVNDNNRACFSDPEVQAAVAQLAAVMTACMGVLSCLTTGWWGSFSDRHGRIRVLSISVIGLLLTDIIFITVYYHAEKLPGGYWFLIIGPLFEGSLGGMTSAVAAIHAYMADTSTAANRSRVFSQSLGIMFTGFAFGPTLGGLIIRLTHQVISVFYAALLSHVFYATMIWFVIPESLTRKKMRLAAEKYRTQTVVARVTHGAIPSLKSWLSFLSPLAVFAPSRPRAGTNPLKSKRDWSLTYVAIVYALIISINGSYSVKFQYASLMFGWDSETLSYWLSLVGASRAFFLAIILPLCIKYFKGRPKVEEPQARMSTEEEPLMSPTSSTTPPPPRSPSHSPSRLNEPNSSKFDLGLARASLISDVIAYTFMALSSSAVPFTIFAMLGSLGSGFSPAIQSVALELYHKKEGGLESGKLFGAMSVLQALSSQILGPAIYGVIYMKTVATVPRMIFFVSVLCVVISSLVLAFVRLPDTEESSSDDEDVEEQLPSPGSPLPRD